MSDSKIILAIETSARIGGVAVVDSCGSVLAEEVLSDGMKHGRLLIPAIDKVLSVAGIDLSALDAIAASIGPGSYTGTRVGVIAAKTLGFAKGIDIVPVSSLQALAVASKCRGGIVVPMQFARSDELYTGVYQISESGVSKALVEDIALEPELVKDMVNCHSVDYFIGSGLEKFEDEFEEYKAKGVIFEDSIKGAPASCIGKVAAMNLGNAMDPIEVEPVYMRRDSSPCSFEKFQN